MCAGLDRAQTNPSSVFRIIINARLLIPGHRAMRTKERQCFNHGSHFSSVVGVCSGTRESEISLGGDDGTKHDINSSMSGSRSYTPSSKSFTINNASTTICGNSPPTIIIASFTCYGTSIGKIRISEFGFGQPEVLVRDTR